MSTQTTKTEIPAEQKSLIEGLLGKVQGMTEDAFKTMLNGMARFHNYSFFNQCIIYACGGSQVAGFKAWKEKDRWVKKGSKAIKILAPKMLYQIYVGGKWERTTRVKHKTWSGKKKSFPVGFFTVNVFDIKDTDGTELPEPMTKKSKIKYSEVLAAAERLGYTVESRPLEFNLGGYISQKDIVVNSNRQETANVGTLIHELAHGLLGHTDTNRPHTRELAEQQAETVTYIVCQELGVERNSVFYLKSWKLSEDIMKDFQELHKVGQKLINEIRSNSLRFILDDEPETQIKAAA
ncbi:ImmA/IrrE family metallo-endopeptidase [bacterium]|nr:ImmA/IrrE family metallo-endopeptidase [bacterium]